VCRAILAFILVVIPLLVVAALLGGWVGFCLLGLAAALVAAALLDPG